MVTGHLPEEFVQRFQATGRGAQGYDRKLFLWPEFIAVHKMLLWRGFLRINSFWFLLAHIQIIAKNGRSHQSEKPNALT
jgi:hypothetical protein